jgi:XRE family transcriptional regulator, regulator of sulfur utilization
MMIRNITRRDITVALIAIALTTGVLATNGQSAAILRSTAYEWNAIPVTKTDVGSTRQFLRSRTATLDELELHVTTLNPGQTSHAPHRHTNEELVIIREGTVEMLVQGEWKRIGPGSVVFNASNELHGIRNVGDGPTTYHVVNWTSPGQKPAP